jgi:hypothetical protein
MHQYLPVLQLLGQRPRLVDVEHLVGRAVLVVADGGGGEGRQQRRHAVRLDPALLLPQQVLRRVEAGLAQPLLVAQPRLEAGVVRHAEARLRDGAGLAVARILEPLGDAHALVCLILLPGEAAAKLLLRAAVEGLLLVVGRAAAAVGERVVRHLNGAHRPGVAATIRVVQHGLLLESVADLRGRARGEQGA